MSIDFEAARHLMVEQQIRPWEVLDPHVLETLSSLKREDFVPARHRRLAFTDVALPLEHDQQMMKPVVEGRLLQALELQGKDEVLEIGTGSGFLTACLARLSRQVTSVELFPDLLRRASDRLSAAGIRNVELHTGDAMGDFMPSRQFDVLVVTGAVHRIPDHFRSWVRQGGRMFVIHGPSPAMGAAMVVRIGPEQWQSESLFETDLPYLRGAEPPRSFQL